LRYWYYIIILVTNSVLADESIYSIYTEEFEPFNYLSKNRQVIGLATRKVERLFQLSEINYKIRINPWFRIQKTVQETPNTYIYSIVRSKVREDKYHWIMPLCPLNIGLFKLSERTDIHASNLEQAKSYIIGVERHQLTVNFLLNKGFIEKENLVVVKDQIQTRGMLNKGRVDIIFNTENAITNQAQRASEQKPWEILFRVEEISQPMYLAANKQSDPDIIAKLKRIYKQEKLNVFDQMSCEL
jgi:polar amino acid transport system substrate-binding protein